MWCARKESLSTLASFKRDSDLDWCEEDFAEEEIKMVETSQQRNDIMVPPHFLGNMFLGEGFKPVYSSSTKHHRVPPVATSTSNSGSLFTIDSILAPRPKPNSPQRPQVFQHPSIHLGHLAAAATSGFGAAPAEFLGMSKYLFHYHPRVYLHFHTACIKWGYV